MFYATQDTDEGGIAENAEIRAFDTRAAAEAFLREPYDNGSGLEDGETFAAVDGEFGDCWIKIYGEMGETVDFGPFRQDELQVLRPGQHPGGKCFWITPSDAVLVAKIAGGEAA